MMRRLTCSEHDRLVWDLALGRLSDAEAEAAESVRTSCPTCSAWWHEELEGEAAVVVEREVGAALERFAPPHRHVVPWWLAAAAILIVALAAMTLWRNGQPPAKAEAPCCVAQVVQDAFQPNSQVDAQDLALSLQGRTTKTPPQT